MKKLTILVLFISAILLSGCNFSLFPQKVDPATLYTLNTSLPAETGISVPAIPFGRITIPTYVDTPQIVTRESNSVVVISERNQWAEPLARAVQRTLPMQVSTFANGKNLKPFSKINVIFTTFDGSLDSKVTLSGRIILQKNPIPAIADDFSTFFSVSVPVKSPTYPDYVDALSEALKSLSQSIAEQITIKNK